MGGRLEQERLDDLDRLFNDGILTDRPIDKDFDAKAKFVQVCNSLKIPIIES